MSAYLEILATNNPYNVAANTSPVAVTVNVYSNFSTRDANNHTLTVKVNGKSHTANGNFGSSTYSAT